MGGCLTRHRELLMAKQRPQPRPQPQPLQPLVPPIQDQLQLLLEIAEKPSQPPQKPQTPQPSYQLQRALPGLGSRTGTPTRSALLMQQSTGCLAVVAVGSGGGGGSRTGSPLHYRLQQPLPLPLSATPEAARRRTSLPPQQRSSGDEAGNGGGERCLSAAMRQSPFQQLQHRLLQQQQQQQLQLRNQRAAPGAALIALFDYSARTEGEVTFCAGDCMSLVDPVDPNWWCVEHKATKACGYVPVALVAVQNSLDAQSWFAGPLPRKEAERQLLRRGNGRGTFLVRESETLNESYSLSVLDCDQSRSGGSGFEDGAPVVKHYRIRSLDSGAGWYITSRQKFPSMQALVDNYSVRADGLCCQLTHPCPRPLPTISDLSYQTKDQWEIPRDQVELLELLGSGQFGEVWRGLFNGRLAVAVKMLKSGSMSRADFLKEARIMKRLRHPKLVQLFAVCTDQDPVYIVTELMAHGSLLAYLRDSEAATELSAQVDIMAQIACGMAYLEAEKFIHRDLAARNILVGESNCVKVADFGLSRAIGEADNGEYTAKQGAKFPIKWTSPEAALLGRFSIKSDVWSYGIVLYEIVTRGQVPYASMSNTETLTAVENGYRMPRPQDCPDAVYSLMLTCWDAQPDLRPTFAFLRDYLEDFFPASEPSYRLAMGAACDTPVPVSPRTSMKVV